MKKLILEPLESASVSAVIVIDALDECMDDEPQSALLSVTGQLAEKIPKVKLLITGETRASDQIWFPARTPPTVDGRLRPAWGPGRALRLRGRNHQVPG